MPPAPPERSGAADPVIAVDVGGTTIKAATMTVDGAQNLLTAPTPRGATRVVTAVADLVAQQSRLQAVSSVGVVVPGIVNEEHGLGVRADNLGWRDAPLHEMLREALPHPVALGHDVRAGALAEHAALQQPVESLAFLPIGTGIAMGLIIDGRPLAAAGYAGEIGHADVGHSLRCVCGLTGCLEAIASAASIAARYSELSGRPADGAIAVARALDTDPVARKIWHDAVEALAAAVAWTASTVAPEAVVVGGGLAASGEVLMAPLRRAVRARLSVQRAPELVPSHYGPYSALHGAAVLARAQH